MLGNSEDIKRRKQLSCAAFAKYKTILCTSQRPLKSRIRSFKCFVEPVFLYNCEIWSISYADSKKINSFQRNFLRQIVRTSKISNRRLYTVCDTDPWSTTIQRRRLAWFGHLMRLPEQTSAKQAYWEAQSKFTKKVAGGQHNTWLSIITKDFRLVGKTLPEAQNIAINKKEYKRLTGGVMSCVKNPAQRL